jgi:hypothetical protein
VECGVAVALWWRITHSGGLLGLVQSASVGLLSTQGYAAGFGDYVSVNVGGCRVRRGGVVEVRVNVLIQPCRVVSWRCVVRLASMSQFDQPVWFALSPF